MCIESEQKNAPSAAQGGMRSAQGTVGLFAGGGGVMGTQLLNKLNEVRRRVKYIQKDKEVKAGTRSYRAVTHDKVTAMVREHLTELGILLIPSVIDRKVTTVTSKTGSAVVMYEGTIMVRFVDVDSGQSESMVLDAHAWDTGDKAPGKALSYAVKYAMLKMFSIETGENDEERVAEVDDVAPRISDEQFSEMWSFFERHPTVWRHPNEGMKAVAAKAGVQKVDELKADEFPKVMAYLKRKVLAAKAVKVETEGGVLTVDKETGEVLDGK